MASLTCHIALRLDSHVCEIEYIYIYIDDIITHINTILLRSLALIGESEKIRCMIVVRRYVVCVVPLFTVAELYIARATP